MKNHRNRYLRRICDMVNEADPHRAVARYVANFRQPGEELESICNKFGVAEIVNERLPFEGGIFCRGDQLIIKLNAASPRTRQTFTLAHETAHLILAPQKAKGARRSFRCTDLESACDTVAAELLMPLEEIRVLASENASVDTLMNLARRFQVSLHAMAVRISDLKLWKHSIGFWRWNEGATELWFVGRRLWQTPKPYFNAFELAMQSQGAIKMSEQYRQRDGVRPALIEVSRLGKEYLLAVILGL